MPANNKHTNKKVEVGVSREADADIQSVPAVSDISIPTNYALITADNEKNGVTDNRADTNPVGRNSSLKGVGVPLNPNNGVTSD